MATYVNDLRLKEIATGDESGTWGTSTNTNLELIAEAFSFGTEAITTNADTHTTTIADGSTDPGRSIYLKYTGTLDSACTITIGPNTVSKLWFIENGTSGSQNIIISQGSGASITIPAGDVKAVYSDGAGSGAAVVDAFASLNVVDLKVQDDLTVTDDASIGGDLTVTGSIAGTLSTAAQTNITSLGTLSTLTVDDITINGSTISDSGDLTLDIGGDIILDADGGNVTFKDGGTAIGDLVNSSSDFVIESKVQDKDIIFKGDDGGSGITALTLDMSAAGAAQFNSSVGIGTAPTSTLHLKNGNRDLNFTLADSPASGDAGVQITAGASDFLGIFAGSSNGELLLGSSGAEKMRIDSSGSIGVGTDSPTGGSVGGKVLHLVNSGATASVRVDRSDSSTTGTISLLDANTTHGLFGTGSKPMAFSTNSTERMRIDSSGNVSIGTTSTNNKLTVSDATNISMSSGAAGQLRIEGNGYSGAIALDANAMHIYQNSSARDIVMGNNETEQLRLDSSGDLFLGTTDGTTVGSPNTNLIIGSTTNNEEVAVTLNNMEGSNNRRGKFFLDDDTGNIGIDCTASSGVPNIVFNTAGTTRLKITSGDGDVIIGGTSVGDVGALTIQPNEDDGAPVLTINRSSTSATSDPIRFKNGGSTVSQIAYNSTEVTYGTGSDARKKNILGEAKGLEIVNKLNPVNFEWKDGGRIQDGLIAQEVKELIPNAVIVNDDGYYSMDYSKLVTPLIKAIQEQQEQIDALQSEINILKGE